MTIFPRNLRPEITMLSFSGAVSHFFPPVLRRGLQAAAILFLAACEGMTVDLP